MAGICQQQGWKHEQVISKNHPISELQSVYLDSIFRKLEQVISEKRPISDLQAIPVENKVENSSSGKNHPISKLQSVRKG